VRTSCTLRLHDAGPEQITECLEAIGPFHDIEMLVAPTYNASGGQVTVLTFSGEEAKIADMKNRVRSWIASHLIHTEVGEA
jgi:hypothetical protein